MPLQATSGAASYDAFGGGVAVVPAYIEEVFSTYLYTGNGSTQTITNGIDLAGKGGLVWQKIRGPSAGAHILTDTARGVGNYIMTDSSDFQYSGSGAQAFNTNGFGSTPYGSGANIASWTFRKQPKFFDVVTWSGTGSNRTIAHNLGSVPGSIIVKRTDTAANWAVYHRSLANTQYLVLNSTAAGATGATWWNSTTPTSTVFSLGTDASVNASGGTYVAYIYAHDAGGFGLTGTDNVISCGSYTTDGSGNFSVNLGYEPQWIMAKRVSSTGDWTMFDTMRGLGVDGTSYVLYANVSNAESGPNNFMSINSTGFGRDGGTAGQTFIYIAIRRGPMQIPTVGTSVFSPNNTSVASGSSKITTTFPVDSTLTKGVPWTFNDRLRGAGRLLFIRTGSETGGTASDWQLDFNNGYEVGADDIGPIKPSYAFRRAPSFFDEVCYTGTGTTGQVVNHNLAATPEMVIIKRRDGTFNWFVYQTGLSYGNSIYLNQNSAQSNDGGPAFALTTTTITFDRTYVSTLNTSGGTYVAYLFATCAGVSKVGSYTGTGSSQVIDCGFTTGARWVMIKRTDSTGDWYVWDTARGMVSGTDPYLLLNSESNEVATLGSVTTVSTGFAVNASILAAINTNGASYIFLAIA